MAAAFLAAMPFFACSSSQSPPTSATGGTGNQNASGSGGQRSSTGGGPSSSSGGAGETGSPGLGGGGPGSGGNGLGAESGGSSGGGSSGGAGAGGTTAAGGALGSGGAGASAGAAGTCSWRNTAPVTIATPFAAPNDSLTFTPPTIPCRMFSITSFGAKSDGTTLNTAAFRQAITAAETAGGGVIDVPAGTFLTGAIHLDSNIELHLESGATIKFSTDTADYLPPVLTRWEGLDVMNWSPMVYALGATNVAITGTGTLQGPGENWGGGVPAWSAAAGAEDNRIYTAWLASLSKTPISGPPDASQVPVSAIQKGLRPTFVECNQCTGFMYDGPKLIDSIYWAIHPLYSKNVIVRNATIDTHTSSSNGDGTDPDSCDTMLIDNVTYSTSDDIIAVKSGLNEVGIAVNRPTHDLVVRNVRATTGHGFSIGSEMSGGVNNVYVTSDKPVTWSGLDYLLRIKTLAGRGGVIQNVFFENVDGTGLKNAVLVTTNYASSTIAPKNPSLIPTIENVTVKNVTGAGGVSLTGLPSEKLQNITFDADAITGTSTCTLVTNLDIVSSSIGLTGTSCN
jgi:polygalacturonase